MLKYKKRLVPGAPSVLRTSGRRLVLWCTGNERGFSLLEIVLALAIVTIGIVGIMVIFPAGLRASQRAAHLTTAATLGAQELQRIKAEGYDALPHRRTPPQSLPVWRPPTGRFPFPPPNDGWSWSEHFIFPPNPSPPPSTLAPLVQATVRIYWTDREMLRHKAFITFMYE